MIYLDEMLEVLPGGLELCLQLLDLSLLELNQGLSRLEAFLDLGFHLLLHPLQEQGLDGKV